ncbi:hypothetical protein H6F67_01110 [Microcoleus sp. FACHB-1515]|uniref:hypothetical protein n=1 Tax=Cyanophyceae TaxID=3028117 RepID=UPI001681CCB6|nr:hypothetical protein [Microcoleus sp. FACHB-1515]MBD2088467.1 hypothetical protein [Microcoleus sp. FACHB-1515]
MSKIISFVKKLRIDTVPGALRGRLLTVCLAGLLLLFTTACNGAANATQPPTSTTSVERARENIRPDGTTGSISNGLSKGSGVGGTNEKGVVGEGRINESVSKNTEIYDPIQPEEGGMNNFSDVDPRFDMSGAEAKTRQLVDETERNVIDQTDDIGTNTRRILDKKGENARDFGGDVKQGGRELKRQADQTVNTATDKLQQAGEDASRNTRRAVNSTSDAVRQAGDDVKRNAQDAAESARDNARKAGNSARQAGDDVKRNARSAADSAADSVDARMSRNINRTQNAVRDAKADVEDNVDKALSRTNRALNRATDSLE